MLLVTTTFPLVLFLGQTVPWSKFPEQLFSRWQQQILNTRWNSDKQGVRTRKMDSRPNVEFIMQNKERLKEWYEYEPYFRAEIERWNNSKNNYSGTVEGTDTLPN